MHQKDIENSMNKKLHFGSNIYDVEEAYPNSEITGFGYEFWVYKGTSQLGYFDSLVMQDKYPLTYRECESAVVEAHDRVSKGFVPTNAEITPI